LCEKIGIEKIVDLTHNNFIGEVNEISFKKSMKYSIKRIYMQYYNIIIYKHIEIDNKMIIKNNKKIEKIIDLAKKYRIINECLFKKHFSSLIVKKKTIIIKNHYFKGNYEQINDCLLKKHFFEQFKLAHLTLPKIKKIKTIITDFNTQIKRIEIKESKKNKNKKSFEENKEFFNKLSLINRNLIQKEWVSKKLFDFKNFIVFKYHIIEILNYLLLKQKYSLNKKKEKNKIFLDTELKEQIIKTNKSLIKYNELISFEMVVYRLKKHLKMERRSYSFIELLIKLLCSSKNNYYYFLFSVLNPPNIIIINKK